MTHPNDNLDLPPELRKSLREMFGGPEFPAGRDAGILATAKRRVRWPQRVIIAGGIAAAVALAATLFLVQSDHHSAMHVAGEAAYVRTGDIRDAFYVARELKAKKALEANWDANGDGVVDEKDVQTLALAAVKLSDARDAGGGVR
jgi:hypothetical protein